MDKELVKVLIEICDFASQKLSKLLAKNNANVLVEFLDSKEKNEDELFDYIKE